MSHPVRPFEPLNSGQEVVKNSQQSEVVARRPRERRHTNLKLVVPQNSADLALKLPTALPSVTIYRSPFSEFLVIICFIVSLGATVAGASIFPTTLMYVSFVGRATQGFFVPWTAFIPLILFILIARNLLNFRYQIGPDAVSEIEGVIGLRERTVRIPFAEIRAVKIRRSFWGSVFNFGDIHIFAGNGPESSELVLRGVHGPDRYIGLM